MSSPIIGGGLTTAPPQTVPSYILSQLLYHAYRMAGALANPGMGISPSESAEGLDLVNFMIEGWKIENLLIVQYLRTYQQIVTGQQEYLVGPNHNGTLNVLRKYTRLDLYCSQDRKLNLSCPCKLS
jgi:hypothetical protein